MEENHLGQIRNTEICIIPPRKLVKYISSIKILENPPSGIRNIISKNRKVKISTSEAWEPKYLLTDSDKDYLTVLSFTDSDENTDLTAKTTGVSLDNKHTLNLQDLHWIYGHIQEANRKNPSKVYLHELMEGCKIILPKNEEIPINQELVERCLKLKNDQQNLEYKNMIRNITKDPTLPEDTIAFQMKLMNQHLIAVLQFVISVAAGFAFGFIGIELLVGQLDFGFRLLLGIIGSLVIALAELYFLAKQLNED